MMHRGTFLALDPGIVRALRACKGDSARRAFLDEVKQNLNEFRDTDKSWYMLFVCFQDSFNADPRRQLKHKTLLALSKLFMGGEKLHGSDFYIINWIPAEEVDGIAQELDLISRDCLRERYLNLNKSWFRAGDYQRSEEQLEYILHWFGEIRVFFATHRGGKKEIVFTSKYQ